MQIFEIEHKDFILNVNCSTFEKSFIKAKSRQSNIEYSTVYNVNNVQTRIYNFEQNALVLYDGLDTVPVFYENADYFFDISFNDSCSIDKDYTPRIYTKLKEIEEKFFYREKLKLLAGSINFGNNLGKVDFEFHYKVKGENRVYNFTFEVFPTKLDYRSDYKKLIEDIQLEYPNLILDYLKKTYSNYSQQLGASNDLIWWQIFGGLYNNFISSTNFILNKPHSRLVDNVKYINADKIKYFTSNLEEDVFQFKTSENKLYKTSYKNLTTDTVENRFFKHALFQTTTKYIHLKKYLEKNYDKSISIEFKKTLSEIEKSLNKAKNNPFFKSIDRFKGFKQESLLIQRGTGYSTIYKNWIMLNSGLSFLDGIQKIDQKNIADLYEIWCFLEVKKIIQNLLGKENPDEIELAQIQIDNFIIDFKEGQKSRILFRKDNGDEIEIFHELKFNKNEENGLKSYTVEQKPDIIVKLTKNDLKEKFKFTYLYDAKYRLDAKDEFDVPPVDSINQMHRYRDSIYYVNKEKNKPEKEVIGGYILFPGNGDIEKIKKQNFYESIKTVNIGAFPLKPNDTHNRELLISHFREILNIDTEDALNNIISQKGLQYEVSNPEVLIGIVSKQEHIDYFNSGTVIYYHSGSHKPTKFGYSSLKYFSPYIKEKGCNVYYEIIEYSVIKRNSIYPKSHILFSKDESERLVLKLGKKYLIDQNNFFKIDDGIIRNYRYTKLSHIRNPDQGKITVLKEGSQLKMSFT